MRPDIAKTVAELEISVCKVILYCLTELRFPLGIKNTISVLRGSKSGFVINYELHKLDTYSLLSHFTRKQLLKIISDLIHADLVEVDAVSEYKNMPVLKITPAGLDYLAGKKGVKVSFLESFVDRNIPVFNDEETRLFDELVKLRRKIAKNNDLRAFMVCSDTTLREMTMMKPKSLDALLAIRGIGKSFVEKYGEQFLWVITKWT
jgi:ATP-dependent DNA helicase RecQ